MNRRHFMAAAGMTSAAIVAAGTPVWAAPARRPNLLIIHTDEHNFRTLGCYRATLPPEQAMIWGPKAIVETPHIDWLAQNGALCTRFYASTPVCSPSRAALVSGRFPQNTNVSTNDIPMFDDVITFAEMLRREGYATGYSGKWHLDGDGKPQWGPKRQFGFADNRYMFNRGHWKQLEDTAEGPRVKAMDAKGNPTYDVAGADEKTFTTDWLADKTIEFIRAHKSESFCYFVSIPDPHGPNTVRPPYDTMFDSMEFEAPKTFHKTEAQTPGWGKKQKTDFNGNYMKPYFGMVKCIDDNVGRILETLRAEGLIDNTIVVFNSDHGDQCGEHARDNKGVPYETSARVAFVLYYPGKVKPGSIVPQALACVDFGPTILSLMNAPAIPGAEGRDASALFLGEAPKDWKDIAFMRSTGRETGSWLAAVTTRYKFVICPSDRPWLIDLEKDPDELTNFFEDASCRDIVRQMASDLREYCQKSKDTYINQPRMKYDLDWCADGEGTYQLPDELSRAATAGAAKATGKAGGKAKGKARKAGDEDEE